MSTRAPFACHFLADAFFFFASWEPRGPDHNGKAKQLLDPPTGLGKFGQDACGAYNKYIYIYLELI